jgi:hypothetical protein
MEKNNTAFSTLGPAATAEFVVEDEVLSGLVGMMMCSGPDIRRLVCHRRSLNLRLWFGS